MIFNRYRHLHTKVLISMFYHLSMYLVPSFSFFNLVRYVSFRAIAAMLTTLFMSLIFFPRFITYSQKFFRAKSRLYTPDNHRAKDDTPTMGGILILFLVTINTLLWCNLKNPIIWIFILCMLSFGAIGAMDDWRKIIHKQGISARLKFTLQLICATFFVILWIWFLSPPPTCIPFFKEFAPNWYWLLIPWSIFIVVATSNAVNLTDGLDGLAISSLIPNFATFSLLAYVAGHTKLAHYLHVPFATSAELSIIGATLIGAALGFLWYNTYPAEIFMGDVGALSLGAALAFLALITRQELLLPLAGGLFVVETCSVILQVLLFRLRGRRIFRMAPLHHHFELLGWQESKITVRFGIISLILSLVALITIKIR